MIRDWGDGVGRGTDSPCLAAGKGRTVTSMARDKETPAAGTRVRIVIDGVVITGHLHANATAQDLLTLLPLTLSFRDLNNVEKIARLPRDLSMDGVPDGDDPDIGDIGYYGPSRDLVFYYGDVGYWPGIVRIGRFDGDPSRISQQPDGFEATVEIASGLGGARLSSAAGWPGSPSSPGG
jgi:hypothetical protein